MAFIERRNPTRCRRQYSADLYIDGVKVGRVDRGHGGFHSDEYSATVDGVTAATGRTLRDIDDELRGYLVAQANDHA